jgi:hypothetical protein
MMIEQAHLGLDDMTGLANGAALPAAARTHLAGCPQCQAETRGWRVVAAGVRTVLAEAQPPAELPEAVLTAIGGGGAAGAGGRALAPAPPGGQPPRPAWLGWRPAAAAAAAVAVLGGTGLGVATALAPGGGASASRPIPAALTATSCRNLKLAVGTLASVSGSTLVIKPLIGREIRVTTSASTKVEREVTGTLAAVRDGQHVIVSGTGSHGQIEARRIGLTPSSLGMRSLLLPAQGPPAALVLGIANGTVADAGTGGFTVDEPGGTHVRVTTSSSTKVVMLAQVTVAQLRTGERTVAVGSVTGPGRLAASTVEQENYPLSGFSPIPAGRLAPLPSGFSPVQRGGFPGLRPRGFHPGFPYPARLSPAPPGPGALFSGLGCNAPAIAATGLLAFGS